MFLGDHKEAQPTDVLTVNINQIGRLPASFKYWITFPKKRKWKKLISFVKSYDIHEIKTCGHKKSP